MQLKSDALRLERGFIPLQLDCQPATADTNRFARSKRTKVRAPVDSPPQNTFGAFLNCIVPAKAAPTPPNAVSNVLKKI
ncbi:MAG: hypothetical protein ABIQ35_11280 [Verrucomicrobiota bacterium]